MWNWFKKKKTGEVDLNCPRCHVSMKKVKKHDVIIDVCPDCGGLWLDKGEMEKLVALGKKHGKKKTKQ